MAATAAGLLLNEEASGRPESSSEILPNAAIRESASTGSGGDAGRRSWSCGGSSGDVGLAIQSEDRLGLDFLRYQTTATNNPSISITAREDPVAIPATA